MTFQFEKLLVYQKALDYADEVCTDTEQFSRGYDFLVDQLKRAALSISANIAEGIFALRTVSLNWWAQKLRKCC